MDNCTKMFHQDHQVTKKREQEDKLPLLPIISNNQTLREPLVLTLNQGEQPPYMPIELKKIKLK